MRFLSVITLAGLASLALSSMTSSARATDQTFNFTGALQTFTVPTNVTSLTVELLGAGGGGGFYGAGGSGALVTGRLTVTSGEVLTLLVGGGGGRANAGVGGFGGGGAGSVGGGGGGRTAIQFGSNDLVDAAGGGGNGEILISYTPSIPVTTPEPCALSFLACTVLSGIGLARRRQQS